jgi:hypothetical protein
VYSPNSLSNLLQQQSACYQNQLQNSFNYQQALCANQMTIAAATVEEWRKESAKAWAEDGEKLIERIEFWRAVLGPLAWPITWRLAKRLEFVTDQLEAYLI